MVIYTCALAVYMYNNLLWTNFSGAVNDAAREVISDLNRPLAEKSVSTTKLLELPACKASPVILAPALSLGPALVTDSERAQERSKLRVEKRATTSAGVSTCTYHKEAKDCNKDRTHHIRA